MTTSVFEGVVPCQTMLWALVRATMVQFASGTTPRAACNGAYTREAPRTRSWTRPSANTTGVSETGENADTCLQSSAAPRRSQSATTDAPSNGSKPRPQPPATRAMTKPAANWFVVKPNTVGGSPPGDAMGPASGPTGTPAAGIP